MDNIMFFRKLKKISLALVVIVTIQCIGNGFISYAAMNDEFYNGTHDEFIVTIEPNVTTININKNFSNRSKSDLISDKVIRYSNGRTISIIRMKGLHLNHDVTIEKVSDGICKYIFDIKDVDYKVSIFVDESKNNLIYDADLIINNREIPIKNIEVNDSKNFKSYNLKL